MPIRFSQELLDNIRRRYEDTDEPVAALAVDMGIRPSSVIRKARKLGWNLRKDRPPRGLPPALRVEIAAAAALSAEVAARKSAAVASEAPDAAAVADRLELAVEKELRTVEIMRATLGAEPQPSADAERTARTLALLTQTLARLKRLRAGATLLETVAAQADADLPADLDAFRVALALRIEKFVRARPQTGADAPSPG